MQLISKQITHPYICSGLGYLAWQLSRAMLFQWGLANRKCPVRILSATTSSVWRTLLILFDIVWGIGFRALGSLPRDYCMSGDNLMGWIGSRGNLGDVEYDLGPNMLWDYYDATSWHNLLTWWMISLLCWSDAHRSLDLCQSTILFACGNIWKGAWQSGSCRHKYIDGLV